MSVVMIRGFVNGEQLFEEQVECGGRDLESVAKEQLERLTDHPKDVVIKIDSLDEPDPNVRFGSDPAPIDLEKLP